MEHPERPAEPAGHDPARPEPGRIETPATYAFLSRLRPGVMEGFAIGRGPARGVLGLAVLAGVVLVGPPAGLGLTLLLLALGFAVAGAPVPAPGVDMRVAGRVPRRDPWWRVWWTLAAALAGIPMLRAATWVVVPSVAIAAALAAAAVSGRVRPLFTRVAVGSWRTSTAAVQGASAREALPAVRGGAIAAGLLAVFIPLLLSADAAFAQLVGDVLPSGSVDLPFARVCVFALVLGAGGALLDARARPSLRVAVAPRRVLGRTEWAVPLGALVALLGAFVATQLATLFGGNRHVLASGSVDLPFARVCVFALVLGAGGALLDARARPSLRLAVAPRRVLGRTEWAVPLGALVALLGAFVATQLATLFGGNRHVLETAGLTYAEYAHSGFAQMAVVAALTLVVIVAAARWARDGGTLLRVLLAALCLLTLVVIASALRRLELYEEAYGFTRLRLTADAILLWLGALFLLVLAGGAFGGAWLPRAAVAVTGAAVLLFALSNPDRRIASRNLAHGRVDVAYLRNLSPDALPALSGVPDAACSIARRLGPGDGAVGWNVARERARGVRVAC